MRKLFVLAGFAAATCAGLGDARALGIPYQRFDVTNGAGSCQAALPSYEGNLRKRPTAIANEGRTNAFVSCSIALDIAAVVHTYAVVINNNTVGDVQMSCTLVSGIRMNGLFEPTHFPQAFVVPAGGHSEVSWRRSVMEPEPTEASANWSCNLPPGTEVGATYAVVMVTPPEWAQGAPPIVRELGEAAAHGRDGGDSLRARGVYRMCGAFSGTTNVHVPHAEKAGSCRTSRSLAAG